MYLFLKKLVKFQYNLWFTPKSFHNSEPEQNGMYRFPKVRARLATLEESLGIFQSSVIASWTWCITTPRWSSRAWGRTSPLGRNSTFSFNSSKNFIVQIQTQNNCTKNSPPPLI